jgi:hypothetical protein
MPFARPPFFVLPRLMPAPRHFRHWPFLRRALAFTAVYCLYFERCEVAAATFTRRRLFFVFIPLDYSATPARLSRCRHYGYPQPHPPAAAIHDSSASHGRTV